LRIVPRLPQPLHHAAAADCAPLVTALLAAGADSGRETSSGAPLHWAAGEGACAAAAALLAAGADANAVDADGMPPLLLAVVSGHAALVETLLSAGADARAAALPGGATVLHVAADVGDARIVAALLACATGREMAASRDADGARPRDVAVAAGDAALCALFDATAAAA
jgi:ankyrin repeat protein